MDIREVANRPHQQATPTGQAPQSSGGQGQGSQQSPAQGGHQVTPGVRNIYPGSVGQSPAAAAARHPGVEAPVDQFPIPLSRTVPTAATPRAAASATAPPASLTGAQLAEATKACMIAEGKIVSVDYAAHLQTLADQGAVAIPLLGPDLIPWRRRSASPTSRRRWSTCPTSSPTPSQWTTSTRSAVGLGS